MKASEIGGFGKRSEISPLLREIQEGRSRVMIYDVHPSLTQFCYKPEQGDRILNLTDEGAVNWSAWEEGLIHQNSVH